MRARIIIEELFYFLSFTLAVFFALELFWPRIVLAYLNFSWLLLFWLIAGFFLLIYPPDK
ncbi:MAG: hypothetical protein PHE24_03665 [Patescibacteria group bacterium]|nr:hypothetical protein [Patescibacteria group bacterium]